MIYGARKTRAQLKIQEMAFVLVAFILFFALVSLFYLSLRTQNVSESAAALRESEAQALVRKLSGSPELRFGGCSQCVDFEKALLLKKSLASAGANERLWDLDYLAIDILYPQRAGGECTLASYPQCNHTTILKTTQNYGVATRAFVTLCYWESGKEYIRCDLATLSAAGRAVSNG